MQVLWTKLECDYEAVNEGVINENYVVKCQGFKTVLLKWEQELLNSRRLPAARARLTVGLTRICECSCTHRILQRAFLFPRICNIIVHVYWQGVFSQIACRMKYSSRINKHGCDLSHGTVFSLPTKSACKISLYCRSRGQQQRCFRDETERTRRPKFNPPPAPLIRPRIMQQNILSNKFICFYMLCLHLNLHVDIFPVPDYFASVRSHNRDKWLSFREEKFDIFYEYEFNNNSYFIPNIMSLFVTHFISS